MFLFIGCFCIVILSISKTKTISQADLNDSESSLKMVIRESRYYSGIEEMVNKLYVEEGIAVTVEVIPDEHAESVIRMEVNTGNAPDILEYNVPELYGLVKADTYLVDLSKESWVSRLTTDHLVRTTDGAIYALPLEESEGLGGIVYNKKLFAKYGLEVPTNQEEFYAVCARLKLEGKIPVLQCNSKRINQMWTDYGFSTSYYLQSRFINSSLLRNLENLEPVLDEYVQLYDQGYINDDYMSLSYTQMLEQFYKDRAGMFPGNYHMISEILAFRYDMELGIFPMPFSFNKNQELVLADSCMSLAIFKDSNQVDLAKKVLEFWSQADYLELLYTNRVTLTPFWDVEVESYDDELLNRYEERKQDPNAIRNFNSYTVENYNLHSTGLWLYSMEGLKMQKSGAEILNQYAEDLMESGVLYEK